MGILKTKGLRLLVQNHFPFATKMPIRNIPFSKIRGVLELNQTKSANGRTDGQTDGRTDELMRCGLFHWERINSDDLVLVSDDLPPQFKFSEFGAASLS
jgi:hypothetical protein